MYCTVYGSPLAYLAHCKTGLFPLASTQLSIFSIKRYNMTNVLSRMSFALHCFLKDFKDHPSSWAPLFVLVQKKIPWHNNHEHMDVCQFDIFFHPSLMSMCSMSLRWFVHGFSFNLTQLDVQLVNHILATQGPIKALIK
jgi:hypothetical protein